MNRFPTWKYALIAFAIAAAFLYTLPNFFGESPAVQVASAKSTVKLDSGLLVRGRLPFLCRSHSEGEGSRNCDSGHRAECLILERR